MAVNGTVTGIVLAAGRSARMGRPKPLLRARGVTFLERTVRLLRDGGCDDVLVVVNGEDLNTHVLASRIARCVVAAPDLAPMPIDSLRIAIAALEDDVTCALMLPVDCPFVNPATVRALIDAFGQHDARAVVPVWKGKPGHPVLIGRGMFDAVHGELAEGLRTLLEAGDDGVVRLSTEDGSILLDIDTPADARREGVDG